MFVSPFGVVPLRAQKNCPAIVRHWGRSLQDELHGEKQMRATKT
jgi:hypothetical protein